MGGYRSERRKSNPQTRLSGLPRQGEAQQPGIAPWLRFSASEMKKYGACASGTECLLPFAGTALTPDILTTNETLLWPAVMKSAVERSVTLSEIDPWLWVRSYCEIEDNAKPNYQMNFRLPYLVGGPQAAEFKVTMTSLPCHFGGTKEFFLCPLCPKRVSFLYLERSTLQLNWSQPGFLHWSVQGQGLCCRSCGGWAYQSQNERTEERDHRKKLKAEWQLLAQGARPAEDAWGLPLKPRGMHWATYQRYVDKIRCIQQKQDALSVGRLVELELRAIKQNRRNRAKS